MTNLFRQVISEDYQTDEVEEVRRNQTINISFLNLPIFIMVKKEKCSLYTFLGFRIKINIDNGN